MLTKNVNGIEYVVSPEEEARIRAEWAAEDAKKANFERDFGYMEKRRFEYPKIADQLDMLFKAIDSDTPLKQSEFYTRIKNVKDKYPKPVEPLNDSDKTDKGR